MLRSQRSGSPFISNSTGKTIHFKPDALKAVCSPSHGLKRSDIKHPSPHHSPGPKAPEPRPRSVSGRISTTSHDTAVATKTTRCHQEEGEARPGRGPHHAPTGAGLCPGATSICHSCIRSGAGLRSACGASSGVQTAVGTQTASWCLWFSQDTPLPERCPYFAVSVPCHRSS